MPALAGNLPVPTGSLRLAGVARLAMAWSGILLRSDEERSRAAGKPISCRKGCGACCNQVVPVSPAEAFSLMDTLRELPPSLRNRRLARIRAIVRSLNRKAASGPSPWHDPDAYFALGEPCPFLVRGSCSIHAERPLACREQLVISDPRLCASFPDFGIHILPLSHSVRDALMTLSAELLGTVPERIPVVAVPDWVREHAEAGTRAWDAGKVADALAFHLFSR